MQEQEAEEQEKIVKGGKEGQSTTFGSKVIDVFSGIGRPISIPCNSNVDMNLLTESLMTDLANSYLVIF